MEEHIKMIQEAYQETHQEVPQPMNINKGKQKEGITQDKKVFLYKLYNISLESSKQKTSELIFIQEEVDNLEKALQILQSPMKTIPFIPPSHYKII